jgi:tetratricopeptide (TPR) repeat protein
LNAPPTGSRISSSASISSRRASSRRWRGSTRSAVSRSAVRGISYTLQALGLVAVGQNKLDKALEHFERARDLHQKLNLKGELVADLSNLGQVYLKMDKLEEAAQYSGKSISLLAEHKNVEEVQQIYLNHYQLLKAMGDEEAPEYLQQAYNAMMAQAAAINDPAKRKIFLDKVRVNQVITAEVAESDWPIQMDEALGITAVQAAS